MMGKKDKHEELALATNEGALSDSIADDEIVDDVFEDVESEKEEDANVGN